MAEANGQWMNRREAYVEKLKDPRWQKMRLKILERDQWRCTRCDDTTNTLHVHHLCYRPGKDPWESTAEELVTFCASCHEEETSTSTMARQEVIQKLTMWPWDAAALMELANFMASIQIFHRDHALDRATSICVAYEYLERLSKGWKEIETYDEETPRKG